MIDQGWCSRTLRLRKSSESALFLRLDTATQVSSSGLHCPLFVSIVVSSLVEQLGSQLSSRSSRFGYRKSAFSPRNFIHRFRKGLPLSRSIRNTDSQSFVKFHDSEDVPGNSFRISDNTQMSLRPCHGNCIAMSSQQGSFFR